MKQKIPTSIHEPLASFNPNGLRALLVDHNPTSLFVLARMLQSCHYQVAPCPQPREALSLISHGECKFDIVISDIHFSPDMNGVQFLEIISRETDLPVVIVSADDRNDVIIKCVKKGACAYLPKPVRMEVIQLLWQHVARKEILRFRLTKQIDNVENGGPDSSSCGEDKEFCGSSDGGQMDRQRNDGEDEQDKVQGKKRRLVWTDELHQQFVDAVKQLGLHNAVPKKVLELMNVPGLTRENVASHLQKYRLNLQKQTEHMQEHFLLPNSSKDAPFGGHSDGQGARLGEDVYIGHNGLFLGTPPSFEVEVPLPLDHHGMDLENKLVFMENNRFHEPDPSPCVLQGRLNKLERDRACSDPMTCFLLFPGVHDFSGRSTPADSFMSNGHHHHNTDLCCQAVQFVQPSNDEDLHFNLFDEVSNE